MANDGLMTSPQNPRNSLRSSIPLLHIRNPAIQALQPRRTRRRVQTIEAKRILTRMSISDGGS